MKTYLTMDVGGTSVNAGLTADDGRILARRRFPSSNVRAQADLIRDMRDNLQALIAGAPTDAPPQGLAVGVPGWINYDEGLLVEAPNMPGWVNVPVVKILREALRLPVRLENDTNMYALGEWRYGAGRGAHNLLVVTLGTGVGGGLVLNDRLWYGSFLSAVEIGHIAVEPQTGAVCGCGRRGCLETIASATGMSRLAREHLASGKPSAYKGAAEAINTEILFTLAQQGDPMALAVFSGAGEALGQILAGAINLLGLEGVVIGGGAAGALDFIKPRLLEILAEQVLVCDPARVKIVCASLGDDAPLLGGALLLQQ